MIDMEISALFQSVRENFKTDCLIYAPHSDSQSGLIEGLKNFGTLRQKILKDPNLKCIAFNKEASRDYIEKSILPNIQGER